MPAPEPVTHKCRKCGRTVDEATFAAELRVCGGCGRRSGMHEAARSEELLPALKLRAHDLLELNVIDDIVPEPPGGAHRDPAAAARQVLERIVHHLANSRRSSQASWCTAGPTARRPSGGSSVASSTEHVISSRESAESSSFQL